MKCVFVETGTVRADGYNRYICKRCKLEVYSPYQSDRVHAKCQRIPHWHEFGGWLELLLESYFITKRPWLWLKHRLGFKPQCNCDKRIESLNAIGAEGFPLCWPAVP